MQKDLTPHLSVSQKEAAPLPSLHMQEERASLPAPGSHLSLLRERHAERQVLSLVRAANFTHCLLQHQLAPQIEVVNAGGKIHIVHGKDLYNEATWRKFLAATPLAEGLLCSLAEGTEEVTRRYRSFLLTAYTPRYQGIARPEQVRWFQQVTYLAVIRRIMETKYRWSLTRSTSAFADAWVGQEMETLMTLSQLATEIAKAIHHIVREPKEQASHLLEEFYRVHAQELLLRIPPPAEPLPPLPQGTPLPLALLETSSSGEHPSSGIAEKEGNDAGEH